MVAKQSCNISTKNELLKKWSSIESRQKKFCAFVSLKAGKDLILQLVKPSPFGEGFTNIHLPAS